MSLKNGEMTRIKAGTYDIVIGDVLAEIPEFLKTKSYTSIAVIVDENTYEHCYPLIAPLFPGHHIISIPSGEKNKRLSTCESIWEAMIENGMDRLSLVINLGGGVIGDMGGFCASCFMRGIDFIQIPTTLLSQVDASIGGKLAVDFRHLKNIIGVFRNPEIIFVDPVFLKTLSESEMRSGYAEILKHALIMNASIWDRLEQSPSWRMLNWGKEITDSVLIKKKVVEADPFEKGLRKVLNFGHTIGHALESFFLGTEKELLHGEAVALGILCESYLSHTALGLSNRELNQITQHIKAVYGDLDFKDSLNQEALWPIIKHDKKNIGSTFKFSLLKMGRVLKLMRNFLKE